MEEGDNPLGETLTFDVEVGVGRATHSSSILSRDVQEDGFARLSNPLANPMTSFEVEAQSPPGEAASDIEKARTRRTGVRKVLALPAVLRSSPVKALQVATPQLNSSSGWVSGDMYVPEDVADPRMLSMKMPFDNPMHCNSDRDSSRMSRVSDRLSQLRLKGDRRLAPQMTEPLHLGMVEAAQSLQPEKRAEDASDTRRGSANTQASRSSGWADIYEDGTNTHALFEEELPAWSAPDCDDETEEVYIKIMRKEVNKAGKRTAKLVESRNAAVRLERGEPLETVQALKFNKTAMSTAGLRGLVPAEAVRQTEEAFAAEHARHEAEVRIITAKVLKLNALALERENVIDAERFITMLLDQTMTPEQAGRAREEFEEKKTVACEEARVKEEERSFELDNKSMIIKLQSHMRLHQAQMIYKEMKDELVTLKLMGFDTKNKAQGTDASAWHGQFKKNPPDHGCKCSKRKSLAYCEHCTTCAYDTAPRDNTLGWLKQLERVQEHDERKYNKNNITINGTHIPLGPVLCSWAFAFRLDRVNKHLSRSERKDWWVKHPDKDASEQKIPLQAWQVIYQLKKAGFHVAHNVSLGANLLELMIGLPYQTLIEEAAATGLNMRLLQTKGMTPFKEELIPRYPQFVYNGTTNGPSPHEHVGFGDAKQGNNLSAMCFSSAHRQILCLSRLKRVARLIPESMVSTAFSTSKHARLKAIRAQLKHKQDIRSVDLYKLLRAFGAYRENGRALFGVAVNAVAREVELNPWIAVHPPGDTSDGCARHSIKDKPFLEPNYISWLDLEKMVSILEAWDATPIGKAEVFLGDLTTYFPLHHKPTLQHLTEAWGNTAHLTICSKRIFVNAKETENISHYSYYDPLNEGVLQAAIFYQPIEEVRDYFGDAVAIYFAWMGLYAHCLIFPALFGFASFVWQTTLNLSPDENPTTIPYSVFFAMWSISFLSAWKQRENEYRFLWGSKGYEKCEVPRVEFKGVFQKNHETGNEIIVHKSQLVRYGTLVASNAFTFACIIGTARLALEATALKERDLLDTFNSTAGNSTHGWNSTNITITVMDDAEGAVLSKALVMDMVEAKKWGIISSICNLLIIQGFGAIYEIIAQKLTQWENHRTNTEHTDALIVKTFLFEFMNNYLVLFYIAYVQPFSQPMEKRTPRSQMKHLELQLFIVFTGKTFIKMAISSLVRKITTCLFKKKLVLKGDAHHLRICDALISIRQA
jgi:hypothetical protein